MKLPRPARAAALFALFGLLAQPGHAADAFRINPQRTSITFDVPAVGWGTTRGTFRAFDGRLSIDFDRPAKSAVNFTVQSASVTTGSPGVDDYIRSEVLFDAARHPTMRFVSTGIEKISNSRVNVTGDLTLLGVTQSATFDVTVKIPAAGVKGGPLGFTARGKVKRTAFGMNSGVPLVSDEVTITVSTEAQE
jgi:polyisoprenoid-binding protein YceI